jgi:hypothetical protein
LQADVVLSSHNVVQARRQKSESLIMRASNVESSVLGRGRTALSSTSVSDERRLLGWAVTLVGAAMMVGGAMIVFLSVF